MELEVNNGIESEYAIDSYLSLSLYVCVDVSCSSYTKDHLFTPNTRSEVKSGTRKKE